MGTGSAGPAAGAGVAKAVVVVETKKEEVEEVDMGNLFGGDDDGYWENCWRIYIWPLNRILSYVNE